MDKVFSAHFVVLIAHCALYNYIGNVGSVLHHTMKHGEALHIYFRKIFYISIELETLETSEQK